MRLSSRAWECWNHEPWRALPWAGLNCMCSVWLAGWLAGRQVPVKCEHSGPATVYLDIRDTVR